MSLDYKNNDAQRSLDKQQILDWQRGWQVINPSNGDLLVTAGAGNFDYDIADGDVNAGGTTVSVSGESVDFTNDIDANDDQIAVIYIDSSGNAQKEIGPKGTRDPSGDDIRSTHTPAAPSMHSTNGVVLAEVLLPAGASSIGSTELRDRRLPAELILDTLTTDVADINKMAAVASLGTDQTIGTGSVTQVNLDSQELEDNSDTVEVDTANNKLIIKRSGLYLIKASLTFQGSANWSLGDAVQVQIKTGAGTESTARIPHTGANERTTLPQVWALFRESSPNTDVLLEAFHNRGGNETVGNTGTKETKLSVTKVG